MQVWSLDCDSAGTEEKNKHNLTFLEQLLKKADNGVCLSVASMDRVKSLTNEEGTAHREANKSGVSSHSDLN